MENKLLIQDLAVKLAAKKKVSVKDAETFLKLFFSTISERVIEDKLVKIKGFGTFKLIDVQDRESVNVNTGERIVIRGHSKISFTPDAELKNKVNKPFELFQTVVINEGTSLEEMERLGDEREDKDSQFVDAEEVASVDEALEQSEILAEKEDLLEEEILQEQVTSDGAKILEEIVPDEKVHEVEVTSEGDTPSVETVDLLYESPEKEQPSELFEQQIEASTKDDTLEEKDNNVMNVKNESNESAVTVVKEVVVEKVVTKRPCCGFCYVTTLILMMVLSYIAGNYHLLSPLGSYVSKTYIELTTGSDEKNDSILPSNNTPQELNQPVVKEEPKENIEELASKYEQLEGGEYVIVGTKSVRIMKRGDNLYMMAKEELGSKDLMRYIVVHNNFKNPNNVHLNKEVKIPELRRRE